MVHKHGRCDCEDGLASAHGDALWNFFATHGPLSCHALGDLTSTLAVENARFHCGINLDFELRTTSHWSAILVIRVALLLNEIAPKSLDSKAKNGTRNAASRLR